MAQRFDRLTWDDSPLVWPLAIYSVDFSIDQEFVWLELDSTFRDIPAFRPKYLCIDNTESNQALRIYFDNLQYPIVPFQRVTFPIPQKCRQVRLVDVAGAALTCEAIFSVEDISAGDTINFGLASNPGGLGVTWPIDVRTGPYNPIATDNHRVEYWFISGATACVLQDQGTIPNGWTIQLWCDETSTANVTVTAANGADVAGAASLILTPGMNIWLIWDGADYREVVKGEGNPEIQIFTASGTWTPSDPTRILDYVEVEVIGGGASGASTPTTVAGTRAVGVSGAAGGYAFEKILAAALNLAGETVTIGAGGAAPAAGANPGNNGGTSSFGAHCSATGGAAGASVSNAGGSNYVAGALGGIGVGGDLNIRGGPSQGGEIDQGSGAPGVMSGNGGDSVLGAGGLGIAQATASGNAGAVYGGGGSGSCTGGGNVQQAGGAGAPGIVIVREFYRG